MNPGQHTDHHWWLDQNGVLVVDLTGELMPVVQLTFQFVIFDRQLESPSADRLLLSASSVTTGPRMTPPSAPSWTDSALVVGGGLFRKAQTPATVGIAVVPHTGSGQDLDVAPVAVSR